MPYCPACEAEYKPGVTRCPDCDVELVAALPPAPPALSPSDWVVVCKEKGSILDGIEDALTKRGIRVVRGEAEAPGFNQPVGIFGTTAGALYTLSVPVDELAARRDEIEAVIAELTGAEPGDAAAQAEAEQDYDVRGCPDCRLFYHDNYAACPLTGTALVPAVEIFAADQLEPDIVVLADGSPEALQGAAARLQAGGLHPQVLQPAGPAVSLLAVPWLELTEQTEAVEGAISQ